MYFFAIRNRNV